jgi:hypothetical protein
MRDVEPPERFAVVELNIEVVAQQAVRGSQCHGIEETLDARAVQHRVDAGVDGSLVVGDQRSDKRIGLPSGVAAIRRSSHGNEIGGLDQPLGFAHVREAVLTGAERQ